jgi:hypothetical protein
MDRKGEKRGKGKQSEGEREGGGELITFHEEELIRMGGRVGWGRLEEKEEVGEGRGEQKLYIDAMGKEDRGR